MQILCMQAHQGTLMDAHLPPGLIMLYYCMGTMPHIGLLKIHGGPTGGTMVMDTCSKLAIVGSVNILTKFKLKSQSTLIKYLPQPQMS